MTEIQQLDLIFETSWEVCNKIGGIYTVLSTKAKTLQKLYKDLNIFIGPDVWSDENPSPFFKEDSKVLKKWNARNSLPYGLKVRVGRWTVPGSPIAVLVDFKPMYALSNQFFGRMWDCYGVDSLHAYGDYDDACAFSHAAGIVIESIYNELTPESNRVIAHFDEWTTGMGLLYVKAALPHVATVFTTHATSIGRSICGNGKNLYQYFTGYNGDQMAVELNMESKHSLEKTAAHQADAFTTVSDVTACECTQLLDITPAVVTPNGFEANFVPSKTRFAQARSDARKKMLEVASALTGYSFDDNTFLVSTSGRCEYRNKGIDVFLDAVSRLSSLSPERKVLAFVMVPAWCAGPRQDLQNAIKGNPVSPVIDAVITHNINNPDSDAVYSRICNLGYQSANVDSSNNVSVIYVPCYLNGDDGIFNMAYYDLLAGMDVTVFPSYYEPWGYTPLESVAFGVPTITTSLSGFGQWVEKSFTSDFADCGVVVVDRTDTNYNEVVETIARSLRYLTSIDKTEKNKIFKAAQTTAKAASWSNFIEFYEKTFEIALENANKRN